MNVRQRSLLWTGAQFVIVLAMVSLVEATTGDDIPLKAQLAIAVAFAAFSGALFYAVASYLERRRSA